VPIVFTVVADPVGAGFVDNLARPGGNATGFTPFEYGIGGKWLEVLKQIAPSVTRVAVLRDSATSSGNPDSLRSGRAVARLSFDPSFPPIDSMFSFCSHRAWRKSRRECIGRFRKLGA
jgi:hypothetical protein